MSGERPGTENGGGHIDDALSDLHTSQLEGLTEIRRPQGFRSRSLALTIEEVAEELSISAATVRRIIASGRLRAVRLGDGPRAHRRVSRAALEEFLNRVP